VPVQGLEFVDNGAGASEKGALFLGDEVSSRISRRDSKTCRRSSVAKTMYEQTVCVRERGDHKMRSMSE